MATSGVFNATLMTFYLDGTAVAYTTDATISGTTAEIDVTNKSSCGNYDLLPGLRDASASCSVIYAIDSTSNIETVIVAWLAGTAVNVRFSTNVSGDIYHHGTAYITGWNLNYPMEDKATGDFSVKFAGALSTSTKT